MAAPYDIDSKHISDKIATQLGCAAMLTSSADEMQRLLDAYEAMKAEAADWKSKYESEKQRADKEAKEKEQWKELAMRPRVILKDHASVGNLITGNLEEHYAENSSIPGQQPLRQLSVG